MAQFTALASMKMKATVTKVVCALAPWLLETVLSVISSPKKPKASTALSTVARFFANDIDVNYTISYSPPTMIVFTLAQFTALASMKMKATVTKVVCALAPWLLETVLSIIPLNKKPKVSTTLSTVTHFFANDIDVNYTISYSPPTMIVFTLVQFTALSSMKMKATVTKVVCALAPWLLETVLSIISLTKKPKVSTTLSTVTCFFADDIDVNYTISYSPPTMIV
jgi:hypothetical protein